MNISIEIDQRSLYTKAIRLSGPSELLLMMMMMGSGVGSPKTFPCDHI